MIDLLRSLPQGVFWYPVVAALAVVMLRALAGVRQQRTGREVAAPVGRDRLAAHAALIQRTRTDSYAETELEKLCMGLLLQATGYRSYSADACRHYLAHEAPARLVPVVQAHLGDEPPQTTTREGTLPRGCELILEELEQLTEEHSEHHA